MLGLYLPNLVVQVRADRRREAIVNGFPDALDLILVCIEAGLSIEAALDRVGREMVHSHPLVAELLSVTVLQLRVHPALIALKQKLEAEPESGPHDVRLTYVTGRGPWYRYSWKGDPQRSGGVATNIGIHFFDMLMWLFGPVASQEVHLSTPSRAAGSLELARAHVTWFLSIDAADLPFEPGPGDPSTFRSVTVDGEEVEFSGGFADLHTRVYEETLAGRGFGLEDARPSVDLAHALRHAEAVRPTGPHHPMLGKVSR